MPDSLRLVRMVRNSRPSTCVSTINTRVHRRTTANARTSSLKDDCDKTESAWGRKERFRNFQAEFRLALLDTLPPPGTMAGQSHV